MRLNHHETARSGAASRPSFRRPRPPPRRSRRPPCWQGCRAFRYGSACSRQPWCSWRNGCARRRTMRNAERQRRPWPCSVARSARPAEPSPCRLPVRIALRARRTTRLDAGHGGWGGGPLRAVAPGQVLVAGDCPDAAGGYRGCLPRPLLLISTGQAFCSPVTPKIRARVRFSSPATRKGPSPRRTPGRPLFRAEPTKLTRAFPPRARTRGTQRETKGMHGDPTACCDQERSRGQARTGLDVRYALSDTGEGTRLRALPV